MAALKTAPAIPFHDASLFLLLRLGVAFCFIGHGAFGLLRKQAWLPYFGLFGIAPDHAQWLMPVVGTVDIVVGVLALVRPARLVFLYAAGWALMTAALRPLAGEGVGEMLERAGNYGVPVIVLLAVGITARPREWLVRLAPPRLEPRAAARMLLAARWTTALLLLGHGVLAMQGSPLLREHATAVGLPPDAVLVQGVLEILAAAAVLLFRSVPLLLAAAAWKLATEALFVAAGAPIWEWVERGGSYAAPLTAAWLLLRPTAAPQAPPSAAPQARPPAAAQPPLSPCNPPPPRRTVGT